MVINQEQYNVSMQRIRHDYIKIDLLNDKDNKLDELGGRLISGSITIDSESDCRRKCNLSFALDNSFIPKEDGKIWLNKRIRIHLGIKSLVTNEIVWFNDEEGEGIFIIENPQINISSKDKTISINGNDKMTLLNGNIGMGILELTTKVPADTPLDEAIRIILSEIGKEPRYMLEKSDKTIPYKLEKGASDNCYTLLKEINNLYMNTEIYYDKNGYFRYGKIKNRIYDTSIFTIDDDVKLTINEGVKYDFLKVRNCIKVIGRMDDKTGIQPKYIAEINDTNNQFHKDKIGRRIMVFNEDKYYTLEQCKIKAEFELENRTNLGEEIDLTLPSLYFLDVNKIIEINRNDSKKEYNGKYLIKNINYNLGLEKTMNISAIKLYA